MMGGPRKHPWQFAHRVLPETFLADPTHASRSLSGVHGSEWMADRWTAAGALLGEPERLGATVNYTFEPSQSDWKVILARPPTPTATGEAWFAALCFKPARATMLVFATASEARYFVLERTDDGAQVREWSADGSHTLHGPVLEPSRTAFMTRIAELLS